jgi:DnaK suppressor protein
MDEIARLAEEGRSDPIEVRDYAEMASVDRETSDALNAATALTHTLEDVRDALQRIEEGSYGKCIVCRKQIEEDRLEAVPWTMYCRKDQEEIDARKGVPQGSTL